MLIQRAIAVVVVGTVFLPSVSVAKDSPMAPNPGAAGSDVPAICREEAKTLGDVGRRMLAELETHLINDVVSDRFRKHDDGVVTPTDVRDMLRRYPTARTVFLFPTPRPLPKSDYRLQMGGDLEELARASDVVFYIQLSDVRQVNAGGKLGLVLQYSSWPTGAQPKGIVWMWGVLGTVCVLREGRGWRSYPLGPMLVSSLLQEKPPKSRL